MYAGQWFCIMWIRHLISSGTSRSNESGLPALHISEFWAVGARLLIENANQHSEPPKSVVFFVLHLYFSFSNILSDRMDKKPLKSSPSHATTKAPKRGISPHSRLFPRRSNSPVPPAESDGFGLTSMSGMGASLGEIVGVVGTGGASFLSSVMSGLSVPSPSSSPSLIPPKSQTTPTIGTTDQKSARDQLAQHRTQTLALAQDGLTAFSGVVRSTLRNTNAAEELNRATRVFAYTTDRAMGVLETGSEYLTGSGPGGMAKTLTHTSKVVKAWEERIRGQKSLLDMADDVWADLDFSGRRRRLKLAEQTSAIGF